eukprot:7926019-Prorocentrum_lima.AAC.1
MTRETRQNARSMAEGLAPNLMSSLQEIFSDELRECGALRLVIAQDALMPKSQQPMSRSTDHQ